MIGMIWDETLGTADLAANGDPLTASAYVSLFTRARAKAPIGAALPNVPSGHWVSSFTGLERGSRLWTHRDGKLDNKTIRLIQLDTERALAWWLADGIARSLTVTVERSGGDRVNIRVVATRPDGSEWDHLWEVAANDL
mgnify:CR=1 FL=1